MEFDQFLEKDILSFLDGKIEHKHMGKADREEEYGLYLTKDFLKELTTALDNDELTKAKKLFDELKQTYNNLPKNSLERRKIYSLLEQMYAKIEAYVKMRTRSGLPGTPIPLVISSQMIEPKERGHVNKLDMQSSIIENQLGNLDKKFSTMENEVSEIRDELTGRGSIVQSKDSSSSDMNIDSGSKKKDTEKKSEKSDEHKNKSKENSIEIFKIPKKTSKDNFNEQKILDEPKDSKDSKSSKDFKDSKDSKEALFNIHEKTPNEDIKTSELIEEMPLPLVNKNVNQEENMQNIDSMHIYKIAKGQKPETSHEPLISVEERTKHLEGLARVERMYFEGIYLFYNHSYQEATKIFEKVLLERPRSKAARIRLQECAEAMESG